MAQLRKAVSMRVKHEGLHVEFSNAFPVDVINEWTQMVEDWDTDHQKPNPYVDLATSR